MSIVTGRARLLLCMVAFVFLSYIMPEASRKSRVRNKGVLESAYDADADADADTLDGHAGQSIPALSLPLSVATFSPGALAPKDQEGTV